MAQAGELATSGYCTRLIGPLTSESIARPVDGSMAQTGYLFTSKWVSGGETSVFGYGGFPQCRRSATNLSSSNLKIPLDTIYYASNIAVS